MIYLLLSLAILFTAERPQNNNQYNQYREIGEYGYPSDPMNDRAKGFAIKGKAKTAVSNYGNIINWDNFPEGLWGNYTYLPTLGLMVGTRGHRYSSDFSWSLESELEGSLDLWCSENLYDKWELDLNLLAIQDFEALAIRVNGDFIGMVFDTEDDRGTIGTRKADPSSLDGSHQWAFDTTEERVCITINEDNEDPNRSDAMIGAMYPWALRPALLERLDEYDLYNYGEDAEDWNEDDEYAFYGAAVSESWFTRINPSYNSDWHASTGSAGATHNPNTTVSMIFANTPFSDSNDTYPLLAHSNYQDTWPVSYDPFWPGWWASVFNENLPGCDGNLFSDSCYEESEGSFTSDSDIYMRFDDRWAHRGNMVSDDNEYEQTGYPMGIEVSTQFYSYGVPFMEDMIVVEATITNKSHDMVMPDGTKLNDANGFDYDDLSIGFYMDADVLSKDIGGSFAPHTNDDDFMEYIDCKASTQYYPDGCSVINGVELRVSLAMIGDWDGESNAVMGHSMDPDQGDPGTDFGLVAVQLLDSPLATEEVDLNQDGITDIYPGEKLKMTDWHWFSWYTRPGVTHNEGSGSCCAGDSGKPQARNKEEIMYKIMRGDTTNISDDEQSWYFHADPQLDDQDPMFNPHFDNVEDLQQTEFFQSGPDGLDCVFIMSSGPFSLDVGESADMSFAVIYGQNMGDLLANAELLQASYMNEHQFFSAPISPSTTISETESSIEISWDSLSVSSVDNITGLQDFEGYRVYRSTDGGNTWGDSDDMLYDSIGVHVGWNPIAQFDYTLEEDMLYYGEDISGYDPVNPWFFLGENSGLQYSITDEDLLPFQQYCYLVTAYDRGVPQDESNPLLDMGFNPGSIESSTNYIQCGSPTGIDYDGSLVVESSWNVGSSSFEYFVHQSSFLGKRYNVEVEAQVDLNSVLDSEYLDPMLYAYEIDSLGYPTVLAELEGSLNQLDSISGLPGVEILDDSFSESSFLYAQPIYSTIGEIGEWLDVDGLYLNILGFDEFDEWGYIIYYLNSNNWGIDPQEILWHDDEIENLDIDLAYAYDIFGYIPDFSINEFVEIWEKKPWFDYEITFGEVGIDTAYMTYGHQSDEDLTDSLTLLPFRIENINSGNKVSLYHVDAGENGLGLYDPDDALGEFNGEYDQREIIIFYERGINPDDPESLEISWEIRLDWTSDGDNEGYPWDGETLAADIITRKPLHDEDHWILEVLEGGDLSNSEANPFIPSTFKLNNPYPNPFNPRTHISYEVPIISNISFIIYDINGRVIEEIAKGMQPPGYYSFNWEAGDYSSGIYFVRMIADGAPSIVKKITFIK